MSDVILLGFVGVVVSFLFTYLPKVKDWFSALIPDLQRLAMVGALIIVSVGVFALSCTPLFNWVVCNSEGAWKMAEFFAAALVGSQTGFLIIPKNKKLS